MRSTVVLLSVVLLACWGREAEAKNVDLVTLPGRDSVQLTIYNSEDLTLAKETRFVTLKRGANRLQFSWAGTLIDPTSVRLRLLAHQEQIDVVDTVYPGQKPQHLFWNVQSEHEGQVPVEVSYFTSGLTWRMDYVGIVDAEEATMEFQGYVRVFNQSGEQYEDAEIRLIVGKINLVEKIAQLARQQAGQNQSVHELKEATVRHFFGQAELAQKSKSEDDFGLGQDKQIVKEGLSEYFMFSIEGVETIANGWSKRMRAVEARGSAFDIVYRLRAYQYGPRPVRFFTWRNDKQHQLGASPLPDGLVRVFRRNQQDGLSFLGQQQVNYTPRGAEIEVNLGVDDLVVYQRRQEDTRRFNFAFHPRNKQVIGWDERQSWNEEVRNYREKPIRLELRLQMGGDVEFSSPQSTRQFDFNTVETILDAPAGKTASYRYQTIAHQGSNAKQNRVRLRPSVNR